MHLCVSHLVVVVIFMIFILLTFLLYPTTVVPPFSLPHCLCMLLVVLSHSFYVLFSATLLLLCHFTFVTRPSPSSSPPPPPLSSCLAPYPFLLCVWLPCGAVLVHILCAFICRARTTDAHWLRTQYCASLCLPSLLLMLPCLVCLLLSLRLLITYRLDSHCQF